MLTKDAINQLQEANTLIELHRQINDLSEVTAIPTNFEIKSLEIFKAYRYRPRGTFSTSSIEGFKSFCAKSTALFSEDEKEAVFIDVKSMAATAILNFAGSVSEQGHCDFKAHCKLEKTAAFKAFLNLTSQAQTQQKVAEFCEDWLDNINFFPSMGSSEELSKTGALAAIRNIKIKATAEAGSNVQNMSQSRSAFESSALDAADQFPGFWVFTCEPYQGLPTRAFTARLNVRTEDKPIINVTVQRPEAHEEDMGNEFASLITSAHAAIFLGSFNP